MSWDGKPLSSPGPTPWSERPGHFPPEKTAVGQRGPDDGRGPTGRPHRGVEGTGLQGSVPLLSGQRQATELGAGPRGMSAGRLGAGDSVRDGSAPSPALSRFLWLLSFLPQRQLGPHVSGFGGCGIIWVVVLSSHVSFAILLGSLQ